MRDRQSETMKEYMDFFVWVLCRNVRTWRTSFYGIATDIVITDKPSIDIKDDKDGD